MLDCLSRLIEHGEKEKSRKSKGPTIYIRSMIKQDGSYFKTNRNLLIGAYSIFLIRISKSTSLNDAVFPSSV